jgi:RNA polymerase sigma factor (TIGR02999 family)
VRRLIRYHCGTALGALAITRAFAAVAVTVTGAQPSTIITTAAFTRISYAKAKGRPLVSSAGEVTVLLQEWSTGKPGASDALFALVYPHLRKIAGALFRGERPENLLQPTSVIHELFLKLIRQRSLRFEDREHFYSLSANLMRRVLVDHARSEKRLKRDGGIFVPLRDDYLWIDGTRAEALDLNAALEELEKIDVRKCRMVELRFFLGFTAGETAELLHVSKASVDRDLRFVRGWLQDRLHPCEATLGSEA